MRPETAWWPHSLRRAGETTTVCEPLGPFVERIADGKIGATAVFAALVACFVALYRGRDRVRLAIWRDEMTGSRSRWPGQDRLAIELSVAAETPFHELALAAHNALNISTSQSPADGGTVEALIRWRDGTREATIDATPFNHDGVEFVFEFLDEGPALGLDVQTTHAASQRISTAAVIDACREAVRTLSRNPATRLSEIGWVSAECRKKLLTEFNDPAVPYERERTILHLFENCARRDGERPALTFGEQGLTYAQLDGKANSLAALLHARGVRAGELIPIVTAGTLELPIAMIALWKLGAAFVPIDVGWPQERLRVILSELKPRVVLHDDESTVAIDSVPRLCFKVATLEVTTLKPLHVMPHPDDLAYGFFTSGSTGVPKCALNFHGGLLNRFLAMSRRFGAAGDDVVLQNSRHVFDSSIWQLLWPLTSGSQVVIPTAGKLLDLHFTIALFEKYRITMTDFVPSIFNALVELIEADRDLIPRLGSLRRLLIGGEEIGARAVQKFRGWLPRCNITNTYGPTEASIGCVFHEVCDKDGWAIPIGRPIDNCYAAIVDTAGRLVPPGIVGEILIGGDCIGGGYLNDPVKTQAAFIANDFPEIPSNRLYRTGDLGYHRPDGKLHFVGRQDHQIKLGGVRIELTEIESVIAAHPAVRAVKVIVEGKPDEAQRLAAYVVAHSDTPPRDITQTVAGSLPAYCVPKKVVMIDRMPLNSNGKVDRKALVALSQSQQSIAPEAMSEVERRICNLWLELLALNGAGLHEDFFSLGGDSLVAVRLGLRLREEFGCKVLTRDIYRCPTISAQAAFIESTRECTDTEANARLAQTLRTAARLDPDIRAGSGAVLDAPDVILLTGATGFVGSHLLHSLLVDTKANVICLIRASDDVTAAKRLRETIQHYRLDANGCMGRTTAIAGDLALAQLGLAEAAYERLVRSVDTIVHCGAAVNFLLGYSALQASNVSGTLELIRLAVRGRPKRIHYISTLAAVAPDARTGFGETELTAEAPFPALGYGQSKSVAERLLVEARTRGVSTVTYRLGEVMPHSRTGVANSRALLDTLIRACLRLGLSFETSLRVDYTPVDYVARFLSAALTARTLPTPVFHVFHPDAQPLEAIFKSFRTAGFMIRSVPYPAFHEALRNACAAPAADPDLLLTLALLPDPSNASAGRWEAQLAEIVADAGGRFSCAQTLSAVESLGIDWPPPGARALETYADFHRRRLS